MQTSFNFYIGGEKNGEVIAITKVAGNGPLKKEKNVVHNLRGASESTHSTKVISVEVPDGYDVVGIRIPKRADFKNNIPICGLIAIEALR